MVFDFYTKKIKVFVSDVSEDVLVLKNRLLKVLNRAGMEILSTEIGADDNYDEFLEQSGKLLKQADCSVHILGDTSDAKKVSIIEDLLKEAQKRKSSEWRDFKIFIWHPGGFENVNNDVDEFISSIRQGIVHNMIYSSRLSVVSFVEDIRSVMFGGEAEEFDVDQADIFFIYNAIDQDTASEIYSMISDILNVKKLEIILSEDVDYSELVAQQIQKTKLVVIYYKFASEWALPFVQQVWKKNGGASSPAPILFLGDSNIDVNHKIEFDAPKVITHLAPQEIAPVEIKVQYDKLDE